MSGESNYFYY